MLAGIRAIPVISTPQDLPSFRRLLGDGSDYGVNFSYAEHPSPDRLAQAFIIGREFIGSDTVCPVLDDNIFFGADFRLKLKSAVVAADDGLATVFGYSVAAPERYGVAEFDAAGKLSTGERKKSPYSESLGFIRICISQKKNLWDTCGVFASNCFFFCTTAAEYCILRW